MKVNEQLKKVNELLTPNERGELSKLLGDTIVYKTMLTYLYGNGSNAIVAKSVYFKACEILAKRNVHMLSIDSIVIVGSGYKEDKKLQRKVGKIVSFTEGGAFVDFFNIPVIKEVPNEHLTRLINLEIDSE